MSVLRSRPAGARLAGYPPIDQAARLEATAGLADRPETVRRRRELDRPEDQEATA